jgi:hypothetical protein
MKIKKFVLLLIAVSVLLTNMALASLEEPVYLQFTNLQAGEVLSFADSHEHARQIAAVYELELESYSDGIAVFFTENPEQAVSKSKCSVVRRFAGIVCNTEKDPFAVLSHNRTYTVNSSPVTDTYYSYSINSSELTSQWHHNEINSYGAWEMSYGEGVVMAIIDTGIDIEHPDFDGRISSISYDSYNRRAGLNRVRDDYGHGTGVAGVAAGENNGYVSGISPAVEIMVIKANIPLTGEFTGASIMRGVNYAVNNGADIINMSLGRQFIDEDGESGYDFLEHRVMRNAVDKGVILIAAAGNEGESEANYPAAYSEVIAVSATRPDFTFFEGSSNYGSQIDISAPGRRIYTAKWGGGYNRMTGTSFSAPSVAGVAALIKSLNPLYTPDEIAQIMYSTAINETGEWDERFGFGILNAAAAVTAVVIPPPVTTTPEITAESTVTTTSTSITVITTTPLHSITEPDKTPYATMVITTTTSDKTADPPQTTPDSPSRTTVTSSRTVTPATSPAAITTTSRTTAATTSRTTAATTSRITAATTSRTTVPQTIAEPPVYTFTIDDALEILKYLAGLQVLTSEQFLLYELNGDGEINIDDALIILKMLASLY